MRQRILRNNFRRQFVSHALAEFGLIISVWLNERRQTRYGAHEIPRDEEMQLICFPSSLPNLFVPGSYTAERLLRSVYASVILRVAEHKPREIRLQHHAAHAVEVLYENGLLAFDRRR